MRHPFASFVRPVLALVLLCGALPLSAAELTPDMTPQQVAAESFTRMRAGDWPGAAATFDPAALRQFRGMLGATDSSGKLAPMLQMLLGVDDAAALARLDDAAFFAGFLKTMMGRAQGMVSLGDQQILGAVPEGDRQIHLVTRNTAEAMGIKMTRMEVVSLNRTPQGWRLALSGQMEGMAEVMRKMSEAAALPAPATDTGKP